MLEKLDFMVRFWDLRARHEAALSLTFLERGELLSLLSLMVVDDPMPAPAPAPRVDGAAVQVAIRGGFMAAELRLVCAEGLVVLTHAPLVAGQSTVLRVANNAEGVEYTLPCVVEWTQPGSATTLALRVDGAPTRMTRAPLEVGAWGVPLGWSDPALASAG